MDDFNVSKVKNNYVVNFHAGKKKANVMDFEAIASWHKAFDFLDKQKTPFGVVIVGSGKFFSPGFDLAIMRSSDNNKLLHKGYELLKRILVSPYPIVACINGHAFGLGFLITLACDYRVMLNAPKVQVCFPEITIT
eukprot:UN05846